MSLFKRNRIVLQKVNTGDRTLQIPVADIRGTRPGKTLLITAGVDGDEYASIEAAYRLIDLYENGAFEGRLIIIPILNVPAFEAESSKNPFDGKLLKCMFPGRPRASETERLAHWLCETYAFHADAWMDMHGGAITERVLPLAFSAITKHSYIDSLVDDFCRTAGIPVRVQEHGLDAYLYSTLAQHGCAYVLTESGGRGERPEKDIARHIAWAAALMQVLGMIASLGQKEDAHSLLIQKVFRIQAPDNGIFYPHALRETVEKGEVLGTWEKYDASALHELKSPADGLLLWHKETMAMRKGDTLFAIGQ